MKAEDILKLIDAGFSHDEIIALDGPADPEPVQKPTVDPEPEQAPEPQQAPAPAEDPNAKRYDELLQAVQKLTGAIQAGNILNSNNRAEETKTAEQIMAEVLLPQKRGWTDVAGEKDLTAEQKRTEMAELMWLNYFNQTLFEKGLISEAERNKIKNNISRRRPSHKSR